MLIGVSPCFSIPLPKGDSPMLAFRLTISSPLGKELDSALISAQRLGDVRLVYRILAVFAYADGQSV